MADQSITALQIRIPAALDAELNRMSSEAGISKNAMMLVLMQLGKRIGKLWVANPIYKRKERVAAPFVDSTIFEKLLRHPRKSPIRSRHRKYASLIFWVSDKTCGFEVI